MFLDSSFANSPLLIDQLSLGNLSRVIKELAYTACALTGSLLEYRSQLEVVVSYSVQLLSMPVVSL